MSDKFFLDTNIFIYSFDAASPAKQEIAQSLVQRALETRNGFISSQVVQEFLNVAMGKFKKSFSKDEAETYLKQVLAPLCEVFPSIELYEKALSIHKKTGFSFYDSLIVAAAIEAGSTILYSEDLQDGRTIDGLHIQNPFHSE